MKKLLLVGINARFTHSNLALRYLRNSITELDIQPEIVEFSINQNLLDILEQINSKEPEVIAFSVYIWNTEIIKDLLLEISKILPNSKVVLGGPEVSYNPEEWFENFPVIHYIITGSGEAGFKFLLENNLKVPEKIISKKNPHFSQIAFPYLAADFPQIKDKYIYYESSRGCSFKCSYCLSSRADQALEIREIETVKKELKFLIDQHPRIIKFVDRTFNAKKEHSRTIWKYLIEQNPKTTFHFEIHPELLDDEDIEILKSCPNGLFQFEIGIQSTNPKTLGAIHRNSDWFKTSVMLKKLIALGNIHIHVDLIAGLPYESLNEFKCSFNNVYDIHADHFQHGFLKILPGTEMAENINQFEIAHTSKNPYMILKNKWLSFNDLNLLHNIEKILNIFYNSGKFKMTLKHLVYEFDSAFSFYTDLLKFLQAKDFDLQTRNWKNNAEMLWEVIIIKVPEQKDLLFDCLKWDWCLQANSHYYPQFLRSVNDDKAKKTGYKYLNSFKQNGAINLDDLKFNVSNFKKAIYFMPVSAKFKKLVCNNSEVIAFVKKHPIFIK